MKYKSDPETLFRGIGVNIPKGATVDEIMGTARLNWEVIVEKPRYGLRVGAEVEAKGRSIVYRSDTLQDLSYCSNDWKPYQNRKFLEDFKKFCDRNDLQIERVGFIPSRDDQFNGSNMVFATTIVPENMNGVFAVDKDDITVMRIIAYNYHSYGKGSGFLTMAERLICTNGMTLLSRGMLETMKHISSHVGDRQYVSNLLESLKVEIANYKRNLEILAQTSIQPGEAMTLLTELLGDSEKPYDKQEPIVKTCSSIFMGEMDELLSSQGINPGMNTLAAYNTYYGLLQSVTAYKTHFSGDVSSSSYLQSRLQGTSAKLVHDFYQKLLEKARDKQKHQHLVNVGIYVN